MVYLDREVIGHVTYLTSGFVSFVRRKPKTISKNHLHILFLQQLSQILKDSEDGGWWEVNHEYESASLHPYIQNAVARIYFSLFATLITSSPF